MAIFYYGNGDCTIEGTDILGVEIRYRGAVKITKTCGDGCLLTAKNNGIIIASLDGGYLNNLFKYIGEFKVTSVIMADSNFEKAPFTIKRVMDYSELIDSKSEDMTINSEKLNSGYSYGAKIKETTVDVKTLKNLHTEGEMYLSNGNFYSGAYHIHLNSGKAMTGAEHSTSSQNLYTNSAKLNKVGKKAVKKKAMRKTKTTSGGTTGGTMGGGGY